MKIRCAGHEDRPTPEQTNLFIRACRKFIKDNPDQIIVVHCTHGFNRTGFLISAFLVDEYNWDISAAVSLFTQARPPGIYKDDYIKELFTRFGDIEDAPPAPEKPDWCFEEEEDDEAGARPDEHRSESEGDNSSNNHHRPHHAAVFMDGVPGVSPVSSASEINQLIDTVRQMTGWTARDPFPGAQPVSMTIANYRFLEARDYMVSWKADGTRYMMLILDESRIYFMDRKASFFRIDGIKFPRKSAPNDHLKNTLLDGEMVIDRIDKHKTCPRYLIYDVVVFENELVCQSDFKKRISVINEEIIEPRTEGLKAGRLNRNSEPFGIRWKSFWKMVETKKLLDPKGFLKGLGHETDGLIFQPVDEPYSGGTDENILKWKEESLNSIDFKVMIENTHHQGMLPEKFACLTVIDGNRFIAMDKIKLLKSNRSYWEEYANQIVECTLIKPNATNPKPEWKVLRIRTDKPNPNSYKTAISVMESIKHPVTKQMLLDLIDKYIKTRSQAMANGQQKKPPVPPGPDGDGAGKRKAPDDMMPPPPPKRPLHGESSSSSSSSSSSD